MIIFSFLLVETKDPIKMDDMWNGLKNHGDKQLRPLIKNMKRLKVFYWIIIKMERNIAEIYYYHVEDSLSFN